jgi:DNA repair exonuclease SbcCD ATPase subunit
MIQFKKVIIHNFGSYSHAELDLQNRGFCLVSGQNNYVKDNASSNGAGKSACFNAICYALTGETISGIKSNLKNINTDEQDGWVQLDFLFGKDLFSLTRYFSPKSDLKILKNDVDLSGKGIRESEKKLQELLPELSKDLIASIIILGQGMPHKFSSFSPSGRKELLEKLTKSDFMIEDLKTRILARQQELSTKVREFEDSIIVNKTQLNGHLNNLDKLRNDINSSNRPEFDHLIAESQNRLVNIQQELNQYETATVELESRVEALNSQLLQVSNEKAKVRDEELTAYNASFTKLTSEETRLDVNISNLKKEIAKLKAIVDICPTCGQHLPDVHKPDTGSLEAQLQQALSELSAVNENIAKCNNQHLEYVTQINNAFNDEITSLNSALAEAKRSLAATRDNHSALAINLENEKGVYNKLVYDKQNWDNFIKAKQNEISQLEVEVSRLTNLISITSTGKDDFDQRLSIIKKMDQLIRRDFRGYLLTNIISYIDTRAKEYCSTVFGTKELTICLNGNALDITYCGKMFDSLSGGEKQRVDLILQLAIRDLLTSYIGLNANILVLDEITDFLDKKSCQAVMSLLEKELQTVESVFIISHRSADLEIPVDGEIMVVKNENGISEIS